MIELNIPEVAQEVRAAFMRYERALNDNDVTTLNELFWKNPLTIRYGLAENLYGHDEIANFRHARPPVDLKRSIDRTVVTTFGRDFATANTEFLKTESGRRGRQTQTWVRMPEGWRIVSAHVSWRAQPM